MKENLKIPTHLAIIVDGNGRWAKAQGKTRSEGHKAGFKRLESIIEHAVDSGVKVLSLYVFSTENFKRSKEEVDYLMHIFTTSFKKFCKKLQKKNARVLFSGRREEPVDKEIIDMIYEFEETTKDNTGPTINFCFNYGGHAEIVDACKKVCNDVLEGIVTVESISEDMFAKYMYQDLPPVDLLIRTSGEQRISNFLLWQLSYAEFYFPKVAFPDFDEKELDLAILNYNKRDRRFGGINYEDKNH